MLQDYIQANPSAPSEETKDDGTMSFKLKIITECLEFYDKEIENRTHLCKKYKKAITGLQSTEVIT